MEQESEMMIGSIFDELGRAARHLHREEVGGGGKGV